VVLVVLATMYPHLSEVTHYSRQVAVAVVARQLVVLAVHLSAVLVVPIRLVLPQVQTQHQVAAVQAVVLQEQVATAVQESSTFVTQPIKALQPIQETQRMDMEPRQVGHLLR
jgi:hypothetical protein